MFAGRHDQIARARAYVTGVAGQCPMLDEAVLLTSEVCINALKHTPSGNGGSFEVILYHNRDFLRVEVRDGGSQSTPATRNSGEMSEHGRGLDLVALVAHRWGHSGVECSRSVFFELRRRPSLGT
jgi:anti-sigma regulatory factor (Ser/Thr protein kinase)